MDWYSSSGKLHLNITLASDRSCSHSGDCQADVESEMALPKYRRQLAKMDPADLSRELGEYGAWDGAELQDHEKNLMRIFWLACCDIAEENHGK